MDNDYHTVRHVHEYPSQQQRKKVVPGKRTYPMAAQPRRAAAHRRGKYTTPPPEKELFLAEDRPNASLRPYVEEEDWGLKSGEAEDLIIRLQEEGRAKKWPPGTAPLGALTRATPRRCDRKLRELVAGDEYRNLRSLAACVREAFRKDNDYETIVGKSRAAFRALITKKLLSNALQKKKLVDSLFDLIDADGDGTLQKREILVFLKDPSGSWTRSAFPATMADDRCLVRIEPLLRALVVDEAAVAGGKDDDDFRGSERFRKVRSVAKTVCRNVMAYENDKALSHIACEKNFCLRPTPRTVTEDGRLGDALRRRARKCVEQLRAAFAALERKNPKGLVHWNDFADLVHSRKLVRGVSADDMDELRLALSSGNSLGNGIDWRAFLDLVDYSFSFYQHQQQHQHRLLIDHKNNTKNQQVYPSSSWPPAASSSGGHHHEESLTAAIRRIFREADTDLDGYLSRRECLEAFDALARREGTPLLDPPQLEGLFQVLDTNNDGFVTYPDLVDYVLREIITMRVVP